MAERFGVAALLALGLLAGCATTTASPVPPTSIETVGQLSPKLPFPKGYLDPKLLPDSLALLQPPPAGGTAAKAADEEAFRAGAAADAERQALAASDADLSWPQMLVSFEALLGVSLSDGKRPHTTMLLRRAAADAGLSTYRAKSHYKWVRPFAEKGVGSCTPQDEAMLRGDGSYPSGHAAIGWMLGLVLTDLVPGEADALLQRGYDFGQSRVVCRVHWMSDTVSGRTMAAATFARLQADPVYRAQRELARGEMAGLVGR